MKVRALNYRVVWLGALVLAVLFASLAFAVSTAVSGRLATATYAALGAVWVVVVVAWLRRPNRVWVIVDGGIVTWRRPAKRANTTPSGRVAVTDIGTVAVVAQDRRRGGRTRHGHIVMLTLLDGAPVTLPIWTGRRVSGPFTAMLDTLRAACPPDMPWDTTAIGGPAGAAVS